MKWFILFLLLGVFILGGFLLLKFPNLFGDRVEFLNVITSETVTDDTPSQYANVPDYTESSDVVSDKESTVKKQEFIEYKNKLSDIMNVFSLTDGDQFGRSVALRGDTMAIGAIGVNSYKGRVYLIMDNNSNEDFTDAVDSDIIMIDGGTPGISPDGGRFGSSVALGDGILVIGAESDNTGGYGRGAIYIIKDGGDDWSSIVADDVIKIDSNTSGLSLTNHEFFGTSVTLGSGVLAVGTDDVVYIIKDGGDDWSSIVADDIIKIDPNTVDLSIDKNNGFGTSVALGNGVLAIGAYLDSAGGIQRGAVYIIKDGGDTWSSIVADDVIKIDSNTMVYHLLMVTILVILFRLVAAFWQLVQILMILVVSIVVQYISSRTAETDGLQSLLAML